MQCIIHDTRYYAPVQLKALVPDHVNSGTSLQSEIDKLEKYQSSKDLIVAVHMNRQLQFVLSELRIPKLNLGGLWLFGSVAPDTSRFMLWGDLLNDPASHQYDYPVLNNPLQPIARENARSG